MWLCVGVAGFIEVLFLTFFRETYHPTILKRRAVQKRKDTGDDSYTTEYETTDQSKSSALWQSMRRPSQIAWSSTILQCLSLWGGVMFSFFYVNSTSLPEILEVRYGFSPSKRGIAYLAWSESSLSILARSSLQGLGLGSLIGITISNQTMDRIYNKLNKRHGGFYPEARLPLVVTGAFLLPVAVALYGWTAELKVPVFGFLVTVTLLCISVVFSVVPMMTFITDAFGQYSASALTAALVTRCLLGASLPLLVPPLSEKIGYGWGFTALASFALLLSPIPCLIMRYGPRWRQRSNYTRDAR